VASKREDGHTLKLKRAPDDNSSGISSDGDDGNCNGDGDVVVVM